MSPDFWLSRWEQNKIGFHQQSVNPYLIEYFPKLGLEPGRRVLVPLCGKSLDMLWLRDQDAAVTGVELSTVAVESFFTENGIEPRITREPAFERYASDGIEIIRGDFFSVRSADVTGVQAVYDRAALIALPPGVRQKYARHLASLLPPDARILLITIEYPENEMQGPPFTVQSDEVETLFAGNFTIEKLADIDVLEENPRFRERGIGELREKVWLLRKKG